LFLKTVVSKLADTIGFDLLPDVSFNFLLGKIGTSFFKAGVGVFGEGSVLLQFNIKISYQTFKIILTFVD
jgi:hypothetical protein